MSEFLPYGKQWIDDDDIQAVVSVLKSDFLTQGPAIEQFEKRICEITGARYCIAVCNGTAALHLAVAALNLEKRIYGITSPITFTASANCMVYNDIRPDFADIDEKTYCIDPDEIEKKINPLVKLLIPVHFAGQTANMPAIQKIAKKHNCYVIEDAAHAIGSEYADGSKVGGCRYSDMTIFSFHPVKTVTTGEGGAITTNDPLLYERLKLLRTHGITKDSKLMKKNPGPWYYEMQSLGFNYRMTDLQAALGLSQLNKLDLFVNRRRNIIKQYNTAFADIENVTIPYEAPGLYSAFHLYVIKMNFSKMNKNRKECMESLKTHNIGSQVHYIPVHLQPFYREQFGFADGDYQKAEAYYEQTLSLPLYPKMTDGDVHRVITAIREMVQ